MIDSLRRALEAHVDLAYKERVRKHFNTDVSNFMGVRVPTIRKIAREHFLGVKGKPVDDVLDLCEDLLETGVYEYKVIAFDWSYRYRKDLDPEHFIVLEGWLKRYVDDWMDCDDLCTHTLGAFLARYPAFLTRVRTWAASPNRWARRASAVSLIYGLRRGRYLEDAFETAQALLGDEDDLVQKGAGWMLKEASKRHPEAVFDYVMQHRDVMPRTTLRYAIERLSAEQRQRAKR